MNNIASRDIVAYYRVSTELRGTHGLGMAAQREAVRLYGERNGYPIVAAYEEVETGRKDDLKNRPALVAGRRARAPIRSAPRHRPDRPPCAQRLRDVAATRKRRRIHCLRQPARESNDNSDPRGHGRA